MDIKKDNKELDEVLDLFISKEHSPEVPWAQKGSSDTGKDEQKKAPPFRETTNIRKQIACPAAPGAQDRIRGLLFEYLQDDYEITRVELRKLTKKTEPDRIVQQEEQICLLIQDK